MGNDIVGRIALPDTSTPLGGKQREVLHQAEGRPKPEMSPHHVPAWRAAEAAIASAGNGNFLYKTQYLGRKAVCDPCLPCISIDSAMLAAYLGIMKRLMSPRLSNISTSSIIETEPARL